MANKDGKCAFHASNVSQGEHRAFRIKCAEEGIDQSQVIRVLVGAWVRGDITNPGLGQDLKLSERTNQTPAVI